MSLEGRLWNVYNATTADPIAAPAVREDRGATLVGRLCKLCSFSGEEPITY